MNKARVNLIHLGLPEDHGFCCQCGLGGGRNEAIRLGPDESEDFHADKGLYRTAGGEMRAQSHACATFSRQARPPDSCHGDTSVSWTSSQHASPGRTDMAQGPESRPRRGDEALDGASTSRFNG